MLENVFGKSFLLEWIGRDIFILSLSADVAVAVGGVAKSLIFCLKNL